MRLQGQVALVTGGATGIGRAVVERYIAEGANVGVMVKEQAHADELNSVFGSNVVVAVGDVRNVEDNQRAVDMVVSTFGKLDCFVGNAGIWDYMGSLQELESVAIIDSYHELFDINVKGYVLGAKAALPALKKSQGSMIFTASTSSYFTGGGGFLYVASKHAVQGLIKALAWELAPDIRVNGVAPGGTLTNLSGPASTGMDTVQMLDAPGIKELIAGITPLGIPAQPEDHAGIYALLASREDARYMTGSIILSDGGIGVGKRPEE
jgi:NAD(P)-dependent dehydrogenase (short-subunit alcohol dehydrogenase family)